MSRRLLAVVAAATLLVAAPDSFADRLSVKLKPGGKLQLDYGRPQWHDSLESAFSSDFSWRFGANSPTVLETEAGLVFDDLVVFPGTYGLNAVFYADHPGRWNMVFHGDGHWYQGGVNHGEFWVEETEVGEDDAAPRFTVEVPKQDDGYLLRATFGARRMEVPFRPAPARKTKGKAGRISFEAAFLARTDLDALAAAVETKPIGVARLTGKKVPRPLRLLLRHDAAADAPTLVVVDTRPSHRTEPVLTLEGQTGDIAAPSEAFTMTVKSGKAAAGLTFGIGVTSYHFELPPSVFED